MCYGILLRITIANPSAGKGATFTASEMHLQIYLLNRSEHVAQLQNLTIDISILSTGE